MTTRIKTITILGSTGSVGTQTVGLLAADPQAYRVRAVAATPPCWPSRPARWAPSTR